MAPKWVVCHERHPGVTLRNRMADEGRPFEVGSQAQTSSYRKLLWLKATVVIIAETWGRDPDKHG
jgi:hypothetical protein